MTDRSAALDDETMKFGLLMESAQAHQQMAATHLEQLRTHTQGLDDVVRDEIRRTLVDELESLTAETARAARTLRSLNRAATVRGGSVLLGCALLCATVPPLVACFALPSRAEIDALRLERDALAQNIRRLEARGAKLDWRSCGAGARLCIRVDRNAPAYGEKSDYFVVKGY